MLTALYAVVIVATLVSASALLCCVIFALNGKWRAVTISGALLGGSMQLIIGSSLAIANDPATRLAAFQEAHPTPSPRPTHSPRPTPTPQTTPTPTPEPTDSPTPKPTITPTPEATTTDPPAIGDVRIVGTAGHANALQCVRTLDDLDAMNNALDAHDDDGFNQAIADGFALHTGQYVRIIDTKGLIDREYQLRILSGPNAHESCWTNEWNGFFK